MKTMSLALLASVAAAPLLAQETREIGAHVHGVSTLELAVEDGILDINLTSPGMDIVGFEYAASTDADKDAVEAAIRQMLTPENIVALPEAAGCRVTEVLVHLHGGEGHHEHAHEEDHDHEGHDHEEHEEGKDHEAESEHSAFHARYVFDCDHTDALTMIGFPFFAQFENAQEIEAEFVTDAGAGAAEVDRDTPELSLN